MSPKIAWEIATGLLSDRIALMWTGIAIGQDAEARLGIDRVRGRQELSSALRGAAG